ncbi:MAG: S24 family peptidase, partial [Odoribacter sp.]
TLTSNPESADNIINMGLKDRLIEFLRYKKITQHAFEISCGLSNGFVDKVGEGTRMSSLDRISEFYPELNIAWLRTGVGEMITTKLAVSENATKGVPYYENTEGTCGIVTQFNDYPESPTFYINYEHFNDCTAYIPVFGDSMFPQYCSGEIIAIKRIYNMDVIQWGEAYFVITNSNANSLKTVKQLHWCEDESKIILRASNPNYKGDTVINKVDIVSLFIIKGKIKRNQL